MPVGIFQSLPQLFDYVLKLCVLMLQVRLVVDKFLILVVAHLYFKTHTLNTYVVVVALIYDVRHDAFHFVSYLSLALQLMLELLVLLLNGRYFFYIFFQV